MTTPAQGRCSDLVSILDQGLECREKSLIRPDCDQDVLERINVMSHNPAEELGQTFDKRGVALRRQSWFITSRILFSRHLKTQCFPLQRPLCTDAWPVLHISLYKKHPGQTWEGRNLGILDQDWRFYSQQPAVRIPPWCKKSDQTIQFQLSDWSSIITERGGGEGGWLQLRAVLGDLKAKNQCEVIELLIKLNGMPLDWSSAEPARRS